MKILIVDDNDRYAKSLENFFEKKSIKTKRAIHAAQGWEFYKQDTFHSIISDITMETQTSGLWMVRNIFQDGYKGNLIIASTGFDVVGVMSLSKLILHKFFGVSYMIPKVPLKSGEVVFVPTYKREPLEYMDKI